MKSRVKNGQREGSPAWDGATVGCECGVGFAFSGLCWEFPLWAELYPNCLCFCMFSASLFHFLHPCGDSLCLNHALCQFTVKVGETQYTVLKLSTPPSKMVLGNGVQCFHLSRNFTLQMENKMVKLQFPVGFCWTLNVNERTNWDNVILAKIYLASHHKMLFNASKSFVFWSSTDWHAPSESQMEKTCVPILLWNSWLPCNKQYIPCSCL